MTSTRLLKKDSIIESQNVISSENTKEKSVTTNWKREAMTRTITQSLLNLTEKGLYFASQNPLGDLQRRLSR
jgi:hypothetical protein